MLIGNSLGAIQDRHFFTKIYACPLFLKYQEYDFVLEGPGDFVNAAVNQIDAITVWILKGEAEERTFDEYPGIVNAGDNEADAFRHAYWSLLISRELGPVEAKKFTDAHERRPSNPESRIMDLHNNQVGRELYFEDPNGDPVAQVQAAIFNGRLMTSPYQLSP
jgi:hypothetical protein